MNRAYSLVTIITKGTDDARVIEGVATTPSTDRAGDVVVPGGARFKLPLPLLWQHQHDKPIGHVEWAEVRADGIAFRARLANVTDPGALKERLDEAWQSIKVGLVRAVSIGFAPISSPKPTPTGLLFEEWDWLELSAVTIPANSEATIANAKFYGQHGASRLDWWQKHHDGGQSAAAESAAAVVATANVPAEIAPWVQLLTSLIIQATKTLQAMDARVAEIEDQVTSPQ